jgi:prohibitin 1
MRNIHKSNNNWSIKKIVITTLLGLIGLISFITFLTSWTDVEPGSEGFIYKPYSDGLDTTMTYQEGTYFVAPWNNIISYNTRQQSKEYKSKVMDRNGTDIEIMVSINYSPIKGKTPFLHLKHGPGYISFIDDKVKGAIKDVVGRYTYEEVYSSKREALEGEIEEILNRDFSGNFIQLHYVEIADVDLPKSISDEITAKETQKQKNLKSELMKIEEKNLAEARIEKARGDESVVISAEFKAQAIRKEAQELARNPQYIDYIRWKGYAEGKGSPYGEGNVFGSGTVVVKELK